MIRKNQPLLILAAGLVVIAMGVVVTFLFIGNNGDDVDVGDTVRDSGPPSVSTRGTSGGPEVQAETPASQFGILLSELAPIMEVNVSETFTQNITTFSSSYWFKTEQEGAEKAQEWRIKDAFQAVFQPKGLSAEVLKGAFYLRVETYQFVDSGGASKAFAHLDNVLKNTTGSDPVKAKKLGNESSAYQIVEGTVGTSETVAVYHRFTFRRGNTIVSVQTWGAQPLMNIDPAREIAAIIDEKLLGARPAVEPTPIPTPNFPGLSN